VVPRKGGKVMKWIASKWIAVSNSSDRGATAVEYGLMVALIAVVIIVAVTALGGKLSGLFNSIAGSI
jgi:pilus assembly protein Flp/PilA